VARARERLLSCRRFVGCPSANGPVNSVTADGGWGDDGDENDDEIGDGGA